MVLGPLIIAGALVAPRIYQNAQAHQPLPGPATQAVPTTTQAPSTSHVPNSTSSPSKGTATTPPADQPVIAPGAVQQIYIPSPSAPMNISAPVDQMPTSCMPTIDPPRDSRMRGVFQCSDFAQAGSHSDGTVVLAGHSSYSHAYNTVFDHLSCTKDGCVPTTVEQGCSVQQSTLTGRIVYLRTSTSGDHWLMYHIDHVYCPSKDTSQDLELKHELWKPTPGRLLLVTCLEQANTSYSTNNLIAVGEFIGVK